MKKLLSIIFLLVVACFTVGCATSEEEPLSLESQSEESNALSLEESDVISTEESISEAISAEETAAKETSAEESTVDTAPDRVVGGYTISYEPYYSFSFNDGIEFDRWLSGSSDFCMLNDKLEEVKIHENEAAEKLRLLIKGKKFYYPTLKGEIQKTSRINVWQMYDDCANVQYTVYGEGGAEYDISFKYFFDEETVAWLEGGIENYYTELYGKTGSAGLSQKYVYSLSSFPVYNHMNYRLLDTEVLVSQYKDDISVYFAFDGILVSIKGSPYTVAEGEYSPENYKNLGFYDMTYVVPIS